MNIARNPSYYLPEVDVTHYLFETMFLMLHFYECIKIG